MTATKKNPSPGKPLRKTALVESPQNYEHDLDDIFTDVRDTAPIIARLMPYAAQIAEFKANKVSLELLAEKLAPRINAPPDIIRLALSAFYSESKESDAARFMGPAKQPQMPPVPAADIKRATLAAMKRYKLTSFTLKDARIIDAIVEDVPALAAYPRHQRNRKIIDAVLGRKDGDLVVRTNKMGVREIAIAS